MPSSEKLFTLDPVATTLTTPTTDVKVQGPVSRKAENSQLVKGLASFSSALGSLGAVKKQREILTDTRLAENAAIRGEAEPAGLFGVASEAFDRIVEANTLNKTLGEIKAFRAGTEGANLVNAPGTLSEKNDAADKVFDAFLAYGYTPIQTPALQADFYQKVEAQRNETKIEIAKVNSDRNKLQVIERLKGVFDEVVTSSSKYSGGTSDQTDIEGASEYPVPFSLTENINPKLINTLAKDVVALDMDIDLPEAKLLTMQVLFQNEDVISQPSVSDKLMASEYAPGITYNALYIKGLSANNTDKDAAEIVKIRNSQIKATSDHFKNLDAQDKADALTRTKNGEAAVAEALTNGQSNEDAYAIGFQFGLTKGEINTLVTAQDKFEGNLKFGINTPEGQAFKKEILAGKNLTDDEITVAAYNRNLDNIPYYKSLAGLENNQIKQIQEAYDKPITLVKANAMMLLKNALRGTNANVPLMIKDSNGVDQFNVAALMDSMGAKGINSIDAMDAIIRLQGIQDDFEHRSNEAAKNGAASNTFSGADVAQFTNSYQTEIRLFVTDLTKDIITIEEVAAARKQEAKEAKKIKEGAEKVEVEPEETSEAIIPPPSAEEQIENLTELKNNPNSLINRLTEDVTIFYNKVTKSKPKETSGILYERDISPVEQKYLDKLNKTITDVTGKIADKEPRTTGLGPAVDAIDSFFDKVGDNAGFLMDTVEDMQREKILYNTFKDFFTTSEAEGAATSQDSDFDPDAPGLPRGFDKDNQPIYGTRNELAKGVGELALSKDFTSTVSADSSKINDPKLSGGTSDESDITSFDDDNVAVTPVVTPLKMSPFEKQLATFELGPNDAEELKGKPYVSSTLAGQLNLKGKARTVTTRLAAQNNASINSVPLGKTGITLGKGHDVTPKELSSGRIYGIPFVDSNGKFIDLDESDIVKIFREDLKIHTEEAKKDFNKKSFGITFDDIPRALQEFLTDRFFNMTNKKMTKADNAFRKALTMKSNISNMKEILSRVNKNSQEYKLNKQSLVQIEKKLPKVLEVFFFNVKERKFGSPGNLKQLPRADDMFEFLEVKKHVFNFFKLQGK